MSDLDDAAPELLADRLPGRWRIVASNFPMWTSGGRENPSIEYELLKADPLALKDVVRYTSGDGKAKTVVGVDRWNGRELRWRGAGVLFLLTSRWSVTGIDKDVLVIRFRRTLVTPAGVDVLVRDDADHVDARAIVAADTDGFGITVEEFASLSWLAGG